MTELNRAGQENSLGHIDTTQKDFRNQIDTLTDMVRQLGGNGQVESGGAQVNNPLNAPYVLFVDPILGRDTFVTGDYATADDGSFDQKMKRISLQRLECGYTASAPFRTLNRAVLEAGIITSREYLNIDPAPCGDLISIVVQAGVHNIINGPGSSASSVSSWSDNYEPDEAELLKFNPSGVGGLILPRGCSVISLDLRKTIIRPSYVPAPADDSVANRRCIFRTTSGGYYYGFTFMDKLDATTSHHLLSCFEYSSKAQLDDFYTKIRNAFSGVAGISDSYATTRNSEWEIVGNFPPVNPPATSDTVQGSSPYIYNCSIRSVLGLCGLYADGSANSGLSSTVIAQFTGVSLQRDMTCFQLYSGGSWNTLGAGDFTTYRDAKPDDVRMRPERRSFHIRATNDAVIQEVSVFAIGTGVHHWCESGAEITITNSNSNFGGVSSLAQGYRSEALQGDTGWSVGTIQVASDMSDESNNIRRIGLGIVDDSVANNATTIVLDQPLAESNTIPGVPDVVARGSYTLRENSYAWIENPAGSDYFALLDTTAWNPANPSQIIVKGPFVTENGESPAGSNALPDIANKRLYIRRLTDVRTVEERQYSLFVNTTNGVSRTPIRDYVLQTDLSAGSISTLIPDSAIVTVAKTAKKPANTGVQATAQIELRRNNPANFWASGVYYRKGDVVQYANKHWIAVADHASQSAFDSLLWDENYVHMEEAYRPEDFYKNAQPLIVFDNDTDPSESSTDLGWFTPGNNWNDNALLIAQYRSATDYKGMHSFLMSLGFSSADAHTILLPKPADQRDRDPSASLDGIGNPSGAANRWANWPIDFRRPSGLRLFGQAWEYTGWSNYTKALPKYQGELSEANKFTYYFTNQNGGRVYPSGFNEEGFAVSSRGLENVETGEILSPEQISSSDQEIIDPPVFDTPATNETQGLVKIANDTQIQQALANLTIDDDGEGFSYVVKVDDLYGISNDILSQAGLLPDGESILYVHKGVVRTSAQAPATSVPSEVRTRYNSNGAIHGTTPVNVVAFRSLPQAFAFINGRDPVSRDALRIELIGDSDADTGGCYHNSKRPITIQGTTNDRTDSRAFIGGTLRSSNDSGEVRLYDCTIAGTGNIANPKATGGVIYTLYINNGLELQNCTITNNTTSYRAMAIGYNYTQVPPDRAYCNMKFGRNYPTTIELDTSAVGTYPGKGGYADNIIGDLVIKSNRGTNYAQNNLIWRASNADPAVANHSNLLLGSVIFVFGGYVPTSEQPSSFDGYGNWDLKWTFDYSKTAGTRVKFSGITKDFQLTSSAVGLIGRSNIEVDVKKGSVTEWQGFQLGENVTFRTVIDNYQRLTTPTMTELVENAWKAAGTGSTKAITVPMYNTYNGAFITVGGNEIAPVSEFIVPDEIFADGPIDADPPSIE